MRKYKLSDGRITFRCLKCGRVSIICPCCYQESTGLSEEQDDFKLDSSKQQSDRDNEDCEVCQ